MTQAVARRGLFDRWRGLSPFTRGFALFTFLVAIVLPLVLVAATGLRVSLMHVRIALLWKFNRDSWMVMDLAREHLAQFPDRLLYQEIFVNGHNMFMYPLTSMLLYEPIKWLPTLGLGQDFWANLVGLAIFLVSVAIVAYLFIAYALKYTDLLRDADRFETLLVFALAAFLAARYVPLVESLDYGNIQTYLSGFFIVGFLCWLQGRKALAGIFIGLICVVKPTLAVFFVWALLRREWRFAVWFAATGGVFLVAAFVAYGIPNNLDYLGVVSYVSHRGSALFSNQTVNGLLNRLTLSGPITRDEAWGAASGGQVFYYANYSALVYYGTLLSTAALTLAALFWRWREYAKAPNVDFLIAGLSFTMASPIAWPHHFGNTAVMFALAFPLALAAKGTGRGWIVALVVSFILLGERFEVPNAWARTPLNILMSIGLFGAVLLLFCLYRLRHVLSRAPAPRTDALEPLPRDLGMRARAA